MITASSAWRTNIARRSTLVCNAIVRIPQPCSKMSSCTAPIRRTAASPRLTIATRLNPGSPSERGSDIFQRGGHASFGNGRQLGLFRPFGNDDRGVDADDRVAAHGAGPEGRREHAHGPVDHALPDGIVDRERDAGGGD